MSDQSDELKRHVRSCPIGWHNGQLKLHRATTDTDVIAWLQQLERLVGIEQDSAAIRTRLPRPAVE
jgi:hypothetical protein